VSKRTKFLLGIGVIAALVIGWQVAAFAVHDTGAFELEGNATNDPTVDGDDWDNVCHQVLGTNCSTTTGAPDATATQWVAEDDLNRTIFTGGGSKDPQDISNWQWKDGAGGLPDKDNLLHTFAARYTTSEGEVLFFGSDRYDNSGDAHQGFWFFQDKISLNGTTSGTFNGLHREGDLLVVSNFSNGGTTSTITVYEWNPACTKTGQQVDLDGPGGNPPLTCGDANLLILASSANANCLNPNPDTACGIVNSQNGTTAPWSYTDKSGNNTYLQGEFFEGGVNLTALGLADRRFQSVASETRSSTSTTAVLKDFILGDFGQCGSSVTTQQTGSTSKSIDDGSIEVTDSATVAVTGTTNWNGTVQFSLTKGPNGTPVDIGTPKNVSNTTPTVTSDAATVTAAGDYCWSATFTSNTEGVPDAVDDGVNECFTVTPVTPQLDTTAGQDVLLGNPVTDTATLAGTANQPGTPVINPTTPGAPAGGTITFTLLKYDCTTLATGTGTNPQTVDVSGNGTYGPVSFTPDAVGTYHWKATYTPAAGDLNNLGSTFNGDCLDSDETVVVNSVPSSMTTAQSFIPNDSATVTASQGGALAGNVHFEAFESSDCSGPVIVDQTKPVSGASPQTVTTTNTTVSTTAANISWRVSYDSTNPAQDDIPATCKEATALTIDNDTTQP
jgi:hypothetical protein